MPNPHSDLSVRIWNNYNKGQLHADLTGRFNSLVFSTALHGGYKECRIDVPMKLSEAWLYVNRDNLPGRHFYHMEISEENRTVWEGRISDIEVRGNSSFVGIGLTAFGYWSSCRDQYYDADDSGNTDWKTGGPHNVGKIIREIVTKECPAINGTVDIDLTSRDVVGIDLTARDYPMDIIIDKLAPLSDSDASIWYFAVWENRKPYWKKRDGTSLYWYTHMSEIREFHLVQEGKHLRNYILPVVGTTEGTGSSDAESQKDYPVREAKISLPTGIASTAANDARDLALSERKFPRQDESFILSGHIYTPLVSYTTASQAKGAMNERPKWWVRAGQTIRIQDFLPASISAPKLDDLRTFHILETEYNALTDELTIQPDRPANRLDILLTRLGQLERDR